MKRLLVAPVLVGLLSTLTSVPTRGEDGGDKVYTRLLFSTAWIVVPVVERASGGKVPIKTGTGSLIDVKNRIVLTNYHVVGDATIIKVFFPAFKNKKELVAEREHYMTALNNGGAITAKVLAKEPKKDLALIQLERIPDGAKPAPLGRESVSPGQRVHSVGNPGASGALWVYTSGTVRQVYNKKWRAGKSEDDLLDIEARVVETQSPTNPGDSGGPLVNDRGELVGVTQGGAKDAQLVSTFIDISEVRTLLAKHKIVPVLAAATNTEPKETPTKPATGGSAAPDDDAAKKEKLAASKFNKAKQFAEDGQKRDALTYCEDILEKYPNTKAAKDAKDLIERLKK